MTCPLIGNYGVNDRDLESSRPWVSGFVVRELARRASNYRATAKLEDWLKREGITGIAGIDTRALTRRLRVQGAQRGVLCTDPNITDPHLVERARAAPSLAGRNLVADVSRKQPMQWSEDLGQWTPLHGPVSPMTQRRKVVALDCGAKLNILRYLTDAGCEVTVMPYDTAPEQILELAPDGLFISNGPGDPSAVTPTIGHLSALIGQLPIFGICLGHQLLALAMGADTYKLRFGHRGANQPVQNLATGKVEITSQNHGFAVDRDSLAKAGGEPTHLNLNDQTLEGFRHASEPVFAVQFHPEASPGPHDSRYLFDCFFEMLQTGQCPTAEAMDAMQRSRSDLGAAPTL